MPQHKPLYEFLRTTAPTCSVVGAASPGHWPGILLPKHLLLQRRRSNEIRHTALSPGSKSWLSFVGGKGSVSATSALEPGPLKLGSGNNSTPGTKRILKDVTSAKAFGDG